MPKKEELEKADYKRFLDDLEETISTKGWKRIEEEALLRIQELENQALFRASNWDEILLARGEAMQLIRFLDLERETLQAREELKEVEEDAETSV